MTRFSKSSTATLSRRNWIARLVRTCGLTVMAAFGIGQVFKARRLANDPDCLRLYTCQDCLEFGGCKLEKAENFRRLKEEAKSESKPLAG